MKNAKIYGLTSSTMTKAMPPSWFSWGWNNAANGRVMSTLGYAVSQEDVPAMVGMLEHSNPAVRRASAEMLGLFTNPSYAAVLKTPIAPLTRALSDTDPEVRRAASDALKLIDPGAVAKAGIRE